jgi:DNA (cytosine-5)-methyltransferase 1
MSEQLTIGGLFEGYGGLTMAVQRAIGGELAWYSEIEPAANRVLEHHHPGVPNLGDITAADWSVVPRVNILTAGFPCQDVSLAGLRTGLRANTRSGLWSHMAVAIDRLRPDLVVIENVRGILSARADGVLEPCPWCVGDDESVPLRALGCVLGDLADIGFDAEWCGLRAADVGAPHSRFRVVVLAWPNAGYTHGVDRYWRSTAGLEGQEGLAAGPAPADPNGIRSSRARASWERWRGSPHHRQPVSDALGVGRGEGRPEPAGQQWGPDAALGSDATAADANSARLQGRIGVYATSGEGEADAHNLSFNWGDYEPAIRHWERILGRLAPAPTWPGKRGGQQLSPVFVEWLMGLDDGYVTTVPNVSRNEALKLLGNGVVPQQIEAGIRFLLPAMLSEVVR